MSQPQHREQSTLYGILGTRPTELHSDNPSASARPTIQKLNIQSSFSYSVFVQYKCSSSSEVDHKNYRLQRPPPPWRHSPSAQPQPRQRSEQINKVGIDNAARGRVQDKFKVERSDGVNECHNSPDLIANQCKQFVLHEALQQGNRRHRRVKATAASYRQPNYHPAKDVLNLVIRSPCQALKSIHEPRIHKSLYSMLSISNFVKSISMIERIEDSLRNGHLNSTRRLHWESQDIESSNAESPMWC